MHLLTSIITTEIVGGSQNEKVWQQASKVRLEILCLCFVWLSASPGGVTCSCTVCKENIVPGRVAPVMPLSVKMFFCFFFISHETTSVQCVYAGRDLACDPMEDATSWRNDAAGACAAWLSLFYLENTSHLPPNPSQPLWRKCATSCMQNLRNVVWNCCPCTQADLLSPSTPPPVCATGV